MRFRSRLALGPEIKPDPSFHRLVPSRGVALTLTTLVWSASSLLLLAVGAASAQTITSKREQAQAIMAEVEQLDMDLASHDRVVELREHRTRPNRDRSRIQREAPRCCEEEPRRRTGSNRREASRPLHQRRRRLDT